MYEYKRHFLQEILFNFRERETTTTASKISRDSDSNFEMDLHKKITGLFSSKVTPAHKEQKQERIEDHKNDEEEKKREAKIYIMLLAML